MKPFIKINNRDNLLVALEDLKKDTVLIVENKEIRLKEDINKGHKIALRDIDESENVIKYGYPIGHAIKDIGIGEWVHTHNIKTNLSGIEEYQYNKKIQPIDHEDKKLTFKGYVREDGKVGIRNELWIVPLVGCVNSVGELIIRKFKEEVNPEGIDAIEVFHHNYGCSQLGDDHENTKKILGDIVKHPNAGGVLVLGLGCENNGMEAFVDSLGDYNKKRVRFLVAQEAENEVEEGTVLLKELYAHMKNDYRQEVSIANLKIGLKCGGSDGLSGITANPLVGKFSDYLISQGGVTVLTEVPEMFGAETILMNRCIDEEVFHKTVNLINNFKQYFMDYKQPVYENPSPGNKAGGITTLEDKSLGCTQKGGNAPVVDVLDYGETIKEKGLNLLSAPGNDLVASTALGAAGCHMVLFTTGRGTPFGSLVPTMKISSNSKLYDRKSNWIDFNSGVLIEDTYMETVVEQFVEYVLEVASGTLLDNEKNGCREISIFKTGVTL
ncbi:altronate hydrolase [Vallitalea longa]|uniref:Altronate hydrolase n=1 Tax=Vallitalea longa TaxID=2936439 RepID=A0A9W6DDW2_9FIRM|nr:altronate dehydratase family protein [Vallitalea longa]GKX27738.1 altronate hydrolase [Vallitalea longa]